MVYVKNRQNLMGGSIESVSTMQNQHRKGRRNKCSWLKFTIRVNTRTVAEPPNATNWVRMYEPNARIVPITGIATPAYVKPYTCSLVPPAFRQRSSLKTKHIPSTNSPLRTPATAALAVNFCINIIMIMLRYF